MNSRRILVLITLTLIATLMFSSCDTLPVLPLFDLSELQIPNFRALQPEGLRPAPPVTPQAPEEIVQVSMEEITTLEEMPGLDWFMPSVFIKENWEISQIEGTLQRISMKPNIDAENQSKISGNRRQ